jgi:putative endonuclease
MVDRAISYSSRGPLALRNGGRKAASWLERPDKVGEVYGLSLMYRVYILQSERNGSYYVGYSEDVVRRLEQHNAGKVKATGYRRPYRLVYQETCLTETEARQREYYIKSQKSRKFIADLIGRGNKGL